LRKEGVRFGAAARAPGHLNAVLACLCALACLGVPLAARGAESHSGDAEAIHRLTYYYPDGAVADSQSHDAGAPRKVFYSSEPTSAGSLPDRLEASNASVSPDGLIEARNGVLYINSLVEGQTLVAQADYISAKFDTEASEPELTNAELTGNVQLQLSGTNLQLSCDQLYYDPFMGQLEASGVSLNLPTEWFVREGELGEQVLRTNFGDSIYTPLPENVRLSAGQVNLALDARQHEFVLRDVVLSHSQRPDPDLYVHADVLRFTEKDQVIMEGFSVHMSGIELFAWPRISRDLRGGKQMVSLDFPIVRFEKDVGFAWKQGINLDLDALQAEVLLDYAPDYGLLSNYLFYVAPYPGTEVGIESGTRSLFDINRVSVERRADYNLLWRQTLPGNDWYRDLYFTVEYGEMAAFTPAQPDQGIPAQRQEDTRIYGDGSLEFPLVELGGNLYLTTGAVGRYAEYQDAGEQYRAAGAFGGLIYRHDGFDHFVLYRAHRISGEPLFSFDEVRQREVDFMTSVRLLPEWRHVVRGIYDIEDGEFNQLKVSALKKQKTYEIGMFWDFARESAGIELGLLVD